MSATNIWFISDLHFGHKSILKHCPKRIELSGAFDENDIETHDKWLMELWNNTIKKKEEVYIVGDFSFYSAEKTKKLLNKLNGRKFLILGNHDKSSEHQSNYFEQITQIKEKVFKSKHYDFLNEDFNVIMCHYPLLTWQGKNYGTVMVHGHCHGRIDDYNNKANDLRIDVGLDGELANYNFVSLEQLYEAVMEKIKNSNLSDITDNWKNSPREYVTYLFDELKVEVR